MKALKLLQKDFLLLKKYVLYIILIPILFTALCVVYNPALLGFPCITIIEIIILSMSLQSLLIAESKDKNAGMFLLATPYSKKTFVLSRYIFMLLEYLICLTLYLITVLFAPQAALPTVSSVLFSLVITMFYVSIIVPLSFQSKTGVFQKILFFFAIYYAMAISLAVEHIPDFIHSVLFFMGNIEAILCFAVILLFILVSMRLSTWVLQHSLE